MKIKATQQIEVDVTTEECFKVIKKDIDSLHLTNIITLLWIKFRKDNKIPEDYYIKNKGVDFAWFVDEGYGHYEHEDFKRLLNEDELKFVRIICDLEKVFE